MIGSLKSMSFLEAFSKWEKLFACLKKTQTTSIEEQYEKHNVRAFDFHITFVNSYKRAVLKYGNINYNTFSMYEYFNFLNKKKDTYVRIVLEEKYPNDKLENRFCEYCKIIETIYKDIKFFGGYREFDKKQLYKFKNKEPEDLIFYERVDKLK
jgi:hypothetical protein